MCVWFTRWWDLPDCVLLLLGTLNTLQIRNPIKGSEIKSRLHFLFSLNLPFQTAIKSVTLIYLPLGNHCLEATGKVGVECEMAMTKNTSQLPVSFLLMSSNFTFETDQS